jgi:hypothetical protein
MIIQVNKYVRQLLWHLLYVDTAVEGSELYFYNTEGDRNPVLSEASCRMDVIRDSSVRKGIVPHGFHKITVAFSSISPSNFDFAILIYARCSILQDAWLTTEFLSPSVL